MTIEKQILLLDDVVLKKEGTGDEVWSWLLEHGALRKIDTLGREHLAVPNSGSLYTDGLRSMWEGDVGLGSLGGQLIGAQMADGRLGLVSGAGWHNFRTDTPQTPLQRIFVDEALEH